MFNSQDVRFLVDFHRAFCLFSSSVFRYFIVFFLLPLLQL